MYGKCFGFDIPTVLPPGRVWVSLALECSQWSPTASEQRFAKLDDLSKTKCKRFFDGLDEIVLGAITKNEELIGSFDAIFERFIQGEGKIRPLDPQLFSHAGL